MWTLWKRLWYRRRRCTKEIGRIQDLLGNENKCIGVICGIVGDQPIFRMLFWCFMEGFQNEMTELYKWMVPLPGGFHFEKQAIWQMLKWLLSDIGYEQFLPDSELSEKQLKHFNKYSHARRKWLFFFQLCFASIIMLFETIQWKFCWTNRRIWNSWMCLCLQLNCAERK